eukprot:scaffold73908_cov35-Tisochrysis_lutea.AAC.3
MRDAASCETVSIVRRRNATTERTTGAAAVAVARTVPTSSRLLPHSPSNSEVASDRRAEAGSHEGGDDKWHAEGGSLGPRGLMVDTSLCSFAKVTGSLKR